MQTIDKVLVAVAATVALSGVTARAQQGSPVVRTGSASAAATVSSDDAKVRAAMHPPGVSLDLKEATPSEVIAALNQALGTTVVAGQGRGIAPGRGTVRGSGGGVTDAGVRFTLKCDNKPLWEVLKQLDKQCAIGVQRLPRAPWWTSGERMSGPGRCR
jgi:hypothetical protein